MPLAVEKEDEFVENEVGHRVPAGTKRKPSGQPADRAAIAVTFCRGGSEKLEKPSEEAIEHCLFFRGRAPEGWEPVWTPRGFILMHIRRHPADSYS